MKTEYKPIYKIAGKIQYLTEVENSLIFAPFRPL